MTGDLVLAIIAKIPTPEGCIYKDDTTGDLYWPEGSREVSHIGRPICSPGHFERTADAPRIAAAIAAAVDRPSCSFLCTQPLRAAVMAVFAAFDSGNVLGTRGAWRLVDAPVDPRAGAVLWLDRAEEIMDKCMGSPYWTELHLALGGMLTGNCDDDPWSYQRCVRDPKAPISKCAQMKSNWRVRLAEDIIDRDNPHGVHHDP